MWKHKNFINLQLCAPPPITTTLNIYVNGMITLIIVGSESSSAGTWTGEQEFNTSYYTINGNTVVWYDGTILQRNSIDVLPTDTIVENGQYTTRAATPTLTFKHFFDAGTIGSGTVKFRHYSQQEQSSGKVIKAGTYQFIEEPNLPLGINIDENITATINTLIDNDVYGNQKTTTFIAVQKLNGAEVGGLILANEEPYYEINLLQYEYTNEDGETFYATDTTKLRTIVIATDQTVSDELYKWAITDGNLVKLS